MPPMPARESPDATGLELRERPVPVRTGSPEERVEAQRLPVFSRALLVLALVFGTYVRVAGVSEQALFGDEVHALRVITRGYGAVLTTFEAMGSHIAFPLLQRIALDLGGTSVLSYRLPALLAGLLALWLLYPLGRSLVGAGPAWLATLVLAVHPLHVYYSRYARAYSLAVLLVLLLCAALVRALTGRGRAAWIAVLVVAAVLPWLHLSTVVTVVLLGLACMVWSLVSGRRADLWRSILVFGGAAVLCLLLHLPAWESLQKYLSKFPIPGGKEPTVGGLMQLLGGTTLAGLAIVAGSALGSLVLVRRRRVAGVFFLCATLAPPLALWMLDPRGGNYAYARYWLPSLAPSLLAAAWGLFELARRFVPERGDALGYGLGAACVALLALAAPLPLRELRGTFSNALPMIHRFPAWDVPFPDTPRIYGELAASRRPLTVVEFPGTAESTLLYRNYWLQHRQRTRVGIVTEAGEIYARGPYVSLRHPAALPRDGEVDCVLVHTDIERETELYLRSFLGQAVEPQRKLPLDEVLELLERAWGEPDFRDGFVVAWRFDRH